MIRRNFHSELLGKSFSIVCTYHTLDLVDQHFGFDFYILETAEHQLKSKLGMDLKRHMLLKLLESDLDDHLEAKYGRFRMQHKHARFVGLSFAECIDLHRKIVSCESRNEMQ